MARRAIAALLACAAVDAFCPGGVPTRRGGRLPLQACAGRDAAAVPSTQTLPRADFTAGFLAAAAAAAGALARPARAGADTPAAARQFAPRFIDVSVDLGRDLVLNVRQPFGLNKERSEGGGDRQGTYVWPASADLAKFLTSEQGRRLVQGRRVLELGAGTAVSGLAAALAGAESVVFTDGSQGVFCARRLAPPRAGCWGGPYHHSLPISWAVRSLALRSRVLKWNISIASGSAPHRGAGGHDRHHQAQQTACRSRPVCTPCHVRKSRRRPSGLPRCLRAPVVPAAPASPGG